MDSEASNYVASLVCALCHLLKKRGECGPDFHFQMLYAFVQ